MHVLKEPHNTFFTSDLHLYHKNIIKYCERPFDDVTEMFDTILDRWKEKITDKDEVHFLGDWALNPKHVKYLNNVLHMLIAVFPGIIRA